MKRPTSSARLITEAAALARIEEMANHGRMSTAGDRVTETAGDADTRIKAAARAAWALGDYHRFAKATVWEVGPLLVEACGISPGQRVLDVAAGTGNTAIRAALAGAEVVASDFAPENFEAGRREAKAQGVELEWVEADVEALPFGAGEFDVVTSSFGAIDLYTFVHYSGYTRLPDFAEASMLSVGAPVSLLAVGGVGIAFVASRLLGLRSVAASMVIYVGMSAVLAFVPVASNLATQLEPTRLMPLQRLFTIDRRGRRACAQPRGGRDKHSGGGGRR